MKKTTAPRHSTTRARPAWAAGAALLLVAAAVAADPAGSGAAAADARFQGQGQPAPIRLTNVTCKAGAAAGTAEISFDLAWDRSWRAAWEEPAERHGGQGALKLENWDAAWVFAKFRQPGALAGSAVTLATGAGDHRVPPGAALDVGLSDDGKSGLGVFVYRAQPGHGANDWQGLRLCWRHGADGVSAPGAAEIKVFAVGMVYVPGGAFWVGDGLTTGLPARFAAGRTTQPYRLTGEQALTLGGDRPENLGNGDGIGMYRAEDFTSEATRLLPAAFPKGHAPFYCMKHRITQGQYVAFANLLTPAQQKLYGQVGAEGLKTTAAAQPYRLRELPNREGGIRTLVDPLPAVYETDRPEVPCAGVIWSDGTAFAAWAGLRPMTELEYEKAGRGPLTPAPNETVSYWGLDFSGDMSEAVVTVGNGCGRRFAGTHGGGVATLPAGWQFAADGFGFGLRGGATSNRHAMFAVPGMRAHNVKNGFRGVRTAPGQ